MKRTAVLLIVTMWTLSCFAVGDPRSMKGKQGNQGAGGQGQQSGQTDIFYQRKKPQLQEFDIKKVMGIEGETEQPEDVAPFIQKLKTSSVSWGEIRSFAGKDAVVRHFIGEYKKKNVVISKPSAQYVQMVEGMYKQKPEIFSGPFEKILEVIAIIEYDFNNGQDKDLMAKRVLGEIGYLNNKKRLGLI